MTDYTIERGRGVHERMNLLAAVRGPATSALLDELGIGARARCLDVGCGGGHVTMELARRVGRSGSVLGIDLDRDLLEIARIEAAEAGLENVTFRVAAVEDLSETDLDLAYARLVLMHVRDAEHLARLMVRAVRPGGTVAIEDAEFSACFTHPRCEGFERWVGWSEETVRRGGGDANIGPRLPALLREVGLIGIGVRVVQDAFVDGSRKHLQEMSMATQRTAVLAAGVTTADEYDAARAEVQAFTADPTTLMAGPRIVQTWGRRP